MSNPNILPILAEFPHVQSLSKTAWAAEEGAEEERDFLVETVRALKSKGYTKEQILEAMEESHGA